LSETLASFNRLSRGEAERRLLACCGSRAWAAKVAAGRPYASVPALIETADVEWEKLKASDWLEAFTAHPRIGERGGRAPAAALHASLQTIADAGHLSMLAQPRATASRILHFITTSAHAKRKTIRSRGSR